MNKVQVVAVDNVLVEALGTRTLIGDCTFVKRSGYKFPVCEMPRDEAMAVVSSDQRAQNKAVERNKDRKKHKLPPVDAFVLKNFRVAVRLGAKEAEPPPVDAVDNKE